MIKADEIFKKAIAKILTEGCIDENPRPKYKDGTPAHSLFITQHVEEFDINKGEFPISTLRPIAIKSSIAEIFWIMVEASNDLRLLEEKYKVHWWREWQVGEHDIANRYGHTIKRYDLINRLIKGLKEDPYSRRHIVDMWQHEELDNSPGLMPCAFQTLWSVRKVNGEMLLDCTLTQRSSDMAIAGIGINQMQYVALQMMIAHEVGMKPGKFVRFVQNLHIYDRHVEQVKELLKREGSNKQPKLILNAEGKGFYDITVDDFELIDYEPQLPQLKFDLGI